MAKITVYKIRDKRNGLYRLAGGGLPGRWSKTGKAWPKLCHVKAHINLVRDWRTRKLPDECKHWEVVTIEVEESEAQRFEIDSLWTPDELDEGDDMLKKGTLDCPNDGDRLHFEVLGMMRVKHKGDNGMFYKAHCPKCNKHFHVKAPDSD